MAEARWKQEVGIGVTGRGNCEVSSVAREKSGSTGNLARAGGPLSSLDTSSSCASGVLDLGLRLSPSSSLPACQQVQKWQL